MDDCLCCGKVIEMRTIGSMATEDMLCLVCRANPEILREWEEL